MAKCVPFSYPQFIHQFIISLFLFPITFLLLDIFLNCRCHSRAVQLFCAFLIKVNDQVGEEGAEDFNCLLLK